MAVTTRARSVSHRWTLRSSSRSGPRSSSFASNVDFRICVAVLILVTIASKCGDALAPTLADLKPLLLLALNANDLHLALTAGRTLVVLSPTRLLHLTERAKLKHFTCLAQVLPYFVVGVARRLEDPAYYLLGWRYGERGELAGRPHAGHGGGFQKVRALVQTLRILVAALCPRSRLPPGGHECLRLVRDRERDWYGDTRRAYASWSSRGGEGNAAFHALPVRQQQL